MKWNSDQPCSQGPFSTSRKYPGCGSSCVYACQRKPHRGWVLNLILSAFSREVNVGLLYRWYFEKEANYLSEILPGQLPRLHLNFYEYEMLIETELCSYFTAFLNNCQQPASDSFNQFFTPKELNNREIIYGNIQLRATFLTENWIYR